jgi:hypothetical protein
LARALPNTLLPALSNRASPEAVFILARDPETLAEAGLENRRYKAFDI